MPLRRVLIVEDNPSLAEALSNFLSAPERQIHIAGTVAEARRSLSEQPPELMLVDFALPDGTGLDVVEAAQRCGPAPAVVAISGTAGPNEGFRFAELGVRAYVQKPIEQTELSAAIQRALERAPDVMRHVRASVGHRSLSSVEEEVRQTMVREALARAQGSRRRAATLLSVSRQFLQHVLRKQA